MGRNPFHRQDNGSNRVVSRCPRDMGRKHDLQQRILRPRKAGSRKDRQWARNRGRMNSSSGQHLRLDRLDTGDKSHRA